MEKFIINNFKFDFGYSRDNYFTDFLLEFSKIIFCLQAKNNQFYYDSDFEKVISLKNNDFVKIINESGDFTLQTAIYRFIDNIISVIEIDNCKVGNIDDVYNYKDKKCNGENFSLIEMTYENDLTLFSNIDTIYKNIDITITKNHVEKSLFEVSSMQAYLAYKAYKDECEISSFFDFYGIGFANDAVFDDWSKIDNESRLKILEKLTTEACNLADLKFDQLGRNRIKSLHNIANKCSEYRIELPSKCIFRIYFLLSGSRITILLGKKKKTQKIDKNTTVRIQKIIRSLT